VQQTVPEQLAIIAGNGAYPRLLAESARKQGVHRIFAVAFRKETDSAIEKFADEVKWVRLGQLGAVLDALRSSGARHAVMAGQITPTNFFRVRFDARMLQLLAGLRIRNEPTVYGAVSDELKAIGIQVLPACSFMEMHMPEAGLLSRRAPTDPERRDIELGFRVAEVASGLDIGQTVVVKEGTILAVEAFEGTNAAIARAADLGGDGIVVVKVAKKTHDMRFDIPTIGLQTLKVLRKARAAVLAFHARRAVLLEREKVVEEADRMNLCLISVPYAQKQGGA
jgi:hypothetical protein